MKSKKGIIILLSVIVLLILVALLKGGGDGKAMEVTAEEAQARTLIETVAASGKIQPEIKVVISSDVSGEIIEMAVREGDEVKKGDLLLKINPDLVESALSRAEAALNTSKANLAGSRARLAQSEAQFINAKASYDRNVKLHQDKVISQSEFDNATSSFEVAQAEVTAAKQNVEAAVFNVKSAEATLKEAQENLGRTSIYAPMDGTITELSKETGERVVGTGQMAGTEIMTLADLAVMEVAVEVNENDIVRVNLGDTVDIEVDAYLDKSFKGLVTEIANSANVVGSSADQVTNFDVKIRILPSSYQALMEDRSKGSSPFRPGMSATVDIRTQEVRDVVSVPIQAVTTRALADSSAKEEKKALVTNEEEQEEDLEECVFVVGEDQVEKRLVKVGVQNTRYIQILEGLELGEKVVTGPYSAISKRLKDKQKVKLVEKEDLYKSAD